MRRLGKIGLAASLTLGLALATSGCLSDDTSVVNPASGGLDAGFPDTSIAVSDAAGAVDGAAPDSATPVDSGQPTPVDAGHEAGVSQVGLAPGAVLARSANYQLVGSSGPRRGADSKIGELQTRGRAERIDAEPLAWRFGVVA